MKQKSNKKITLGSLAGMIERSFDEVHQKMDQKFDGVNSRLDNIDKKLEGIVYRNEFDELEARMKIVEDALAINHKK